MERKFKVRFMNQNSKKTSQNTFRIEKVLRRKEDKSLVKWMGHNYSFNSWLDTKSMVKLTTEQSL